MTSRMAAEIAECPQVAELSIRMSEDAGWLARRFRAKPPPVIVLCGRGSSGHAALFLRYLIETRLRAPVSMAAPSVASASGVRLNLSGAWFIAVSQSGESPDLVASAQAARDAGALTVGLVNAPQSRLGRAVDICLPLRAGAERSIAATKSVLAAMALGARLVAECAGDEALRAALTRLPRRVDQALACDWDALGPEIEGAHVVYTLGRGLGLAVAKEVALKMTETLRTPAFAYSAAEVLHGPRAAISDRSPVIGFEVQDETSLSVRRAMLALREGGARAFSCGGGDLAWIAPEHPAADAIAMLPTAWRFLEAQAQRCGYDPDQPPFLNKVTRTV